MPEYRYECPNCKNKTSKFLFMRESGKEIKCSECGTVMMKLVPKLFGADVFPSDGVYLEHVSPEGKTFHSKQEMKDYEKKHKVELGYLHG